MRSVIVNLSLRPARNDNLYRLMFSCALVAIVLVTGSNLARIARYGYDIQVAKSNLHEKREALAELDVRERALGQELQELDMARLQKRSEFANMAIFSRVFSWTELFNELEQVMPIDARLSAVRPSVSAQGRVDLQLEGVAKNYAAFVALEEALMKSESFSRVYPGSERLQGEAFRTRAPNLPLRRQDARRGGAAASPAAPAPAAQDAEVAFKLSCEYYPGGWSKDETGDGGARP